MGLSSSTAKTTSSQNTTQTGTTTPVAPDWLTGGLKDYIGSIGSFADADPNSFVAGASPLQQQAWGNTDRLGLWSGNSNAASNIAMNAANAAAPQLPGAAGYSAARGGVSTYSPATLANPREATATGYNAAQAGRVGIAPTANASATDANPYAVSQFMGNYKNPYENDVVNTTLAGFDYDTAQRRAQMEAQGAKAGAFGGSRFGLAQGQFESDNASNRAQTEAQLRSAGFDKAAALGSTDAGAFNQASLFNAQNRTGVSTFNAGAENTRGLAQAGYDAQIGLGNAGAQNEAAAFGATAQNNAGMANQNASNTFALSQAGAQNDAARYGADANNASMASYLGRADQAASQGAAAQNTASLFNAQSQENGLARQLQAAGLLNGFGNDYGANTRADLGAMEALGTDQRNVEQGYALSPLAQLQATGQLFGATPYQALVGQNINATGTANGTGTQTTTPSLFSMLMQMGSSAANAYSAGGG